MGSGNGGRESKAAGKRSVGSGNDSGEAGDEFRCVWEVDPGVGEKVGIAWEAFRGMGKSSWERRLGAKCSIDRRNSDFVPSRAGRL